MTELTAAAAICLTPQIWIDEWNSHYRTRLAELSTRIDAINGTAGFEAFRIQTPDGGWSLPLHVSPTLIPGAASSVDAFAVLMHYGGDSHGSGIAMLPGELFGYRAHGTKFVLRATLAASEEDLRRFTDRLRDATTRLTSPEGPCLVQQALKRARMIADVDAILASCRY